ncbi:MAG TPA: SIS domain-containing protein [bacterium]|nr:SIS domain-containing protein [bacterium]HPN32415.1 SIS domain-containing protein [bacterium]
MKKRIAGNIRLLNSYLSENENGIIDSVEKIAAKIIETLKNSRKILTFGNGGSAADAQHFAAELVGRFMLERSPYQAICINENISNLTAIANDYGYERVFERQINGLCKRGDLILCYSASGNSPNILKGVEAAKLIGAFAISMTGYSGGKLSSLTDMNFNVSINNTARVQEVHCLANHLICEIVEDTLK